MKKDGKTLSKTAKRQVRDLNWADHSLYDYFKAKLDKEGLLLDPTKKMQIIFLVKMIGAEKVKEVADLIIKRSEQVSVECLQPDRSNGWMSSPVVKAEKKRNQTCIMYTKGLFIM